MKTLLELGQPARLHPEGRVGRALELESGGLLSVYVRQIDAERYARRESNEELGTRTRNRVFLIGVQRVPATRPGRALVVTRAPGPGAGDVGHLPADPLLDPGAEHL